jgi:lantibiotic biosynthesis protein
MTMFTDTTPQTDVLHKIVFDIEEDIDRTLANGTTNDSLTGGKAGIALFYAQLFRQFKEPRHLDRSCELITDCLISLQQARGTFDFASGISGILWSAKIMTHWGLIDIREVEGIEEINKQIGRSMEIDARKNIFDFFYGFIGKGIYLIDPYPENVAIIEDIIHYLDALGIRDDQGITWEQTFIANRKVHAGPCYELGMAHGISGIILFLSKTYQQEILSKKSKELIEGAVSWMLNKKGISKHNYFPSLVPQVNDSSKLGWCVGDLGIGAAIWTAACALQNRQWMSEVEAMLELALNIDFSRSNIFLNRKLTVADSGFCHGLAGNAYMFNQYYRAMGHEALLQKANYWVAQLLAYRDHSTDALHGGFYSFRALNEQQSEWCQEIGALTGTCGIGLTLLSFLSNEFQNPLGKMFLVDMPRFQTP